MSDQMNKASLLEKIQSERALLNSVLSELDESSMAKPEAPGEWSVKDTLAHIVAWHRRSLVWLVAARTGETPNQETISNEAEVNRFNEQSYLAQREKSLAVVLAELDETYDRIMAEIEALPEEALLGEGRYEWLPGTALWQVISWDTFEHYREHRQGLGA